MREICREGRVFCQSVMLVGLIGNTVRCRWPAVYQTYHANCFILGPTSPWHHWQPRSADLTPPLLVPFEPYTSSWRRVEQNAERLTKTSKPIKWPFKVVYLALKLQWVSAHRTGLNVNAQLTFKFPRSTLPFRFPPLFTFLNVCVGKDVSKVPWRGPIFCFPWKLFGKVDIFGAYICLWPYLSSWQY